MDYKNDSVQAYWIEPEENYLYLKLKANLSLRKKHLKSRSFDRVDRAHLFNEPRILEGRLFRARCLCSSEVCNLNVMIN